METAIFEMIINTSGVALALSLLFYFSIKTFQIILVDRNSMQTELKVLQNEFHSFKNQVIEKFINTMLENTDTLNHLRDELEKKIK
jgi:hypothetical protein